MRNAVLIILLLSMNSCITDNEKVYLNTNSGNTAFIEGDNGRAQEEYSKGLKVSPENGILNFNRASLLYIEKKYQEAVALYDKAPKDYYTGFQAGNTHKRLGDMEMSNPQKRIELYKKALSFYEQAIKLNEAEKKVKFNYELVRKMTEELEKQMQQQQQNQQPKDKEQQDNKDNKQKEQENKEKQDKQKDADKKENKEGENKQQKEDKDKKDMKEASEAEKQKKKEEALNILKALQQNEKDDLKNNQQLKFKKTKPEKNDW